MQLVEIVDVPLLKTGTYRLRTGETTFTDEDLDSVVAAQHDPVLRPIRVGPGHDSRHDGTPSFGFVESLRRVGDTVLATLRVPSKLRDIIATCWPNRSIEGRRDVATSTGHRHRLVIDRLALLGMTSPGIDLDDLHELMAAMTTDDFQGTEVSILASARQEEHMTPSQLRAKLGLPEDATEEAVEQALDRFTGKQQDEPDAPDPPPEGETQETKKPAKPKAETPEPPPPPPDSPEPEEEPEGPDADTVSVSREQWEAVQEEIAASRADRQQREHQRRQGLIAAAVDDGRIADSAQEKWRARLDEAPKVTEDILASLEPTIPLGPALGHASGGSGGRRYDPFEGSGATTATFGSEEYPGGRVRPGELVTASAEDPLALPGDNLFSERDRERIKAARLALRGA